ncbi:hypothetical protein PInf_008656 [Phytophthora infestans]|nr:hypothetical protein PInf_008656 [Phytophthora infestans]
MPKQQVRREAQSTDYVDDPLVTVEDIANEDADMEGLENKACDDARKVDTLPGGKDTGAVAGENDSASGEKSVAAGEKDVATGEKDVDAGENDDATSFAAGEKDVAAGENDDATSVAASEKDDAAREKAVAADAKATAAEPGDNNALADTDYARAFVDAAQTNAIEESRKRKQLSVPHRRKSCHGAFEMNESEDPSPKRPKPGTESLGSTGAHFTASAKSKIVRRRTKTYDSREKMMKAHQA